MLLMLSKLKGFVLLVIQLVIQVKVAILIQMATQFQVMLVNNNRVNLLNYTSKIIKGYVKLRWSRILTMLSKLR